MKYLLRITDKEAWIKAKKMAVKEGTTLRFVIEKFIKFWGSGKVKE